MSPWGQPYVVNENPDWGAIRAEYIELRAFHPHRRPDECALLACQRAKIANPLEQSILALQEWQADVDVDEEIRRRSLKQHHEAGAASKATRLAQLQALAENPRIEAKDRIAAYRLISELEGEITKQVDKKTEAKGAGRTFNINIRRDDGPVADGV